jgi:hypothetical protein
MLKFFPAPYPDEIMYSVLCRYHVCTGNKSSYRTNLELWGKTGGKNVLLPNGIECISDKIPAEANLAAGHFIAENTIFPFLKPFIPKKRAEIIYGGMKSGKRNNGYIFTAAGFAYKKFSSHKYLRHCEQCVAEDILAYGETYWHRVHQVPGVYVCPKHGTVTADSDISIFPIPPQFRPASCCLIGGNETQDFTPDIKEKLMGFARDAEWLLLYGSKLGYSARTSEIYRILLEAKGFRHRDGKNRLKKLSMAVTDFYGQDFLSLMGVYGSGICLWTSRILQKQEKINSPVHHLLLIRFLAGSAEEFFRNKRKISSQSEHLPFGKSPYPCRNHVCEYYMKDTADILSVKKKRGRCRAVFACPYCGMIYTRQVESNKVFPKEKKYSGQIRIVEYGWRWKELLKCLLIEKNPVLSIMKTLRCGKPTVLRFGVEFGILPKENLEKIKPRVQKIPELPSDEKLSFYHQRNHYRKRWKAVIETYPDVSRAELRLVDGGCYEWLRNNDKRWFERQPPSKEARVKVDWSKRDNEYLEMVKVAVEQIKNEESGATRVTKFAVAKRTSIGTKVYKYLASGKLPKTREFLDKNL